MGTIAASYLLKLHLHVEDDTFEPPTLDQVKEAVTEAAKETFGVDDATISLAERTDD